MLKLIFILMFMFNEISMKPRQEGATVTHCNKKYFEFCYAITKRNGRGMPYRTNMNFKLLQSWNDNVTSTIAFGRIKDEFVIRSKTCQMINVDWFSAYLKTFSNITASCPVPANNYAFTNMEWPPKNFPLPVFDGNKRVVLRAEITKTGELMTEVVLKLNDN